MPNFSATEYLILILIAVVFIVGIPSCIVFLVVGMARMGKRAPASGLWPKPPDQSTMPSRENFVEKLEQLKQMLDAGLISAQEYEAKKADILSRM